MIRLRPFKKTDCEAMAGWFPERRAFAMWCVDKFSFPMTKEQLLACVEEQQEIENAWNMAALDREGKLVGHFSIREIDYEKGSGHLGFIVIDPQQRGKGYGKEMVRQAVRYAFEQLGLNRVTLNVIEENRAAHACYLALGFREEGRSERAYAYEGEAWTLCHMANQASR